VESGKTKDRTRKPSSAVLIVSELHLLSLCNQGQIKHPVDA